MPKALSEEKQEIIYKYYPVLKAQEVADMVGMKKENLIAWAHRHGISNNYYWTKDEEEYLLKWYGKMSAKAIAKKLGRSYRAVLDKLQKIQMGNFIDNADGLTLAEVCRLVGRDKETIKKTWVKCGLKIRKKGKYSMIKECDLLEFMENNPDRWNAAECECWYFERYTWFKDKNKKYWDKLREERWKNAEKVKKMYG